jgi:hypothetical protein
MCPIKFGFAQLTDWVAIDIKMLRAPQRSDGSLFEQLGVCRLDNRVSNALGVDAF